MKGKFPFFLLFSQSFLSSPSVMSGRGSAHCKDSLEWLNKAKKILQFQGVIALLCLCTAQVLPFDWKPNQATLPSRRAQAPLQSLHPSTWPWKPFVISENLISLHFKQSHRQRQHYWPHCTHGKWGIEIQIHLQAQQQPGTEQDAGPGSCCEQPDLFGDPPPALLWPHSSQPLFPGRNSSGKKRDWTEKEPWELRSLCAALHKVWGVAAAMNQCPHVALIK